MKGSAVKNRCIYERAAVAGCAAMLAAVVCAGEWDAARAEWKTFRENYEPGHAVVRTAEVAAHHG